MQKNAFIHLHGLLLETAEYLDEEGELDIDMSEYDDLKVNPVGIHQSKQDHEDAVEALFDSILSEIEDEKKAEIEAAVLN